MSATITMTICVIGCCGLTPVAAIQDAHQYHLVSCLQDGDDVVQLLHMDMVDEDSQHTAALLSRSIFATAAAHASDPVSSAAMQFGAGLSRAPSSKLKHQTGPGKEPSSAVSRGADAAADSFTFQMFGKDLTNSSRQPGAKQHQVT